MTQDETFAILKTGANVFLTGEPGSGKTHTVNRFTAWLRSHGVEPAITASTGIAATHIGGLTIHSWSGIGVKRRLSEEDLDHIAGNKRVAKRIRHARTLIIDEISMLSPRTLGLVEAACRAVRGGSAPFGELQVVLVGDFFQLPPVVTRDEREDAEGGLFEEEEEARFAFDAPAWRALNPEVCYLSEQHRQGDAAFLEALSAIRAGRVDARHRALLASRRGVAVAQSATQLFSHNVDVDRVNNAALARIPGEAREFRMTSHGAEHVVDSLKKGCLSPEALSLKVGARVLFTKNDPAYRFVNGTLGEVTGFADEGGYPLVRTTSGAAICAEPVEWVVEDGGRTLARVVQIPLRLAWAITVHKSQGMSLDAAHVDLSHAFEHGQGYVALSRVRTLAGLSLAGFNERALEVHPEVCEKDAAFRAASQAVHERYARVPAAEFEARQKEFLRACGGSLTPLPEDARPGRAADARAPRAPKQKTHRWEETLALIREGKSVAEVARERGRTPGTIIGHLEELLVLEKLGVSDIKHLAKGNEEEIADVHEAFRELGDTRLQPAYEWLHGRVPYDLIRLARLLFVRDGAGE
ncbi:MAG: helix-turn-helix domain-containing protein [Candidatus Liptonbacteria bacterium]|nr:helix-turn-helix domain-containing protein [Candidatus Liptonbacteria bacterium]